jgi:NitT/TauT family transport system substrate-binding protein
METREIDKSLTNGLSEAKRRGFSRRSVLSFAGAFGAAAPFGIFGAARALTNAAVYSRRLSYLPRRREQ